jgi:hypothetical protein
LLSTSPTVDVQVSAVSDRPTKASDDSPVSEQVHRHGWIGIAQVGAGVVVRSPGQLEETISNREGNDFCDIIASDVK